MLVFDTQVLFSLFSPIKLSYTIFDPKNGPNSSQPTMIILHGLFGSKKNFESLSKVFAMKTGFRVVTADIRNHGDSPHTSEMNYESMSEDLMLLMKDLQIDRTILLGHSMGGKIAMTLALSQPQLVETLIVEDIAPTKSRSVEVSGFPTYIAAMEKVVFDHSLTSMPNARKSADIQLTPKFPDPRIRSFVLTNLEKKDGRFQWRINLDAIKNNLEDLAAFPSFGDKRYLGNALFIGGSKSPQIREELYPEIRSMFPKAVFEHLHGAGHWAHADKPHEFTDVLLNYLRTLYPSVV